MKALGRLSIIDKPWLGNKMQYLDFWISPDGSISDVKFN